VIDFVLCSAESIAGMSRQLAWGFGLAGISLFLVALEFVVPSGGLIAAAAILSAIGAIIAFFLESTTWGLSSLLAFLILGPVIVNFALKVIPNTPMGRRLILSRDEEEEQKAVEEEVQRHESERALVGAEGVALTDLRPVGTAEIEGTRIEVLAEGGVVTAGTAIRVTSVEGNQIKVRARR